MHTTTDEQNNNGGDDDGDDDDDYNNYGEKGKNSSTIGNQPKQIQQLLTEALRLTVRGLSEALQ